MSVLLRPVFRRLILASFSSVGLLAVSGGDIFAADQQSANQATSPGFNIEAIGSEAWNYDTNPLLLSHGATTLSGSVTSAKLIVNSATPTNQFSLSSQADQDVYNNSKFNTNNFHEVLSLSRNIQRWSAGLQGNYDYDTTRSSELSTFGIAIPSVRHTAYTVTPVIAFKSSEADKFSLSSSYQNSTYDNIAFTDYNLYNITPTYTHIFTQNNSGYIALPSQRYETAIGPDLKSDSIGPSLGWVTVISPRTDTNVSAGFQKTSQSGIGAKTQSSSLDYIFSGSLHFKGDQDITNFNMSRGQHPFGNGTETLLTTFSVDEAHAINEKISLTASGNYQFADYSSHQTGINLDKTYGGSVGIAYHVLTHVDVTGNYQYKAESLTNTNGSIKDNTLMIGLTYHPGVGTL